MAAWLRNRPRRREAWKPTAWGSFDSTILYTSERSRTVQRDTGGLGIDSLCCRKQAISHFPTQPVSHSPFSSLVFLWGKESPTLKNSHGQPEGRRTQTQSRWWWPLWEPAALASLLSLYLHGLLRVSEREGVLLSKAIRHQGAEGTALPSVSPAGIFPAKWQRKVGGTLLIS